MTGSGRIKRLTAGVVLGFLMMTAVVPRHEVLAAKEPTYAITEETKNMEATIGRVTVSELNVRTGIGATNDLVKVDGKTLVLHTDDRVAIMSRGYTSSNVMWYEVRWVENGVEYHGYVNASYVKDTKETAVPLPTPTPEATPTPTPAPTPTATPTPLPTPTATPAPVEEPDSSGLGKGLVTALEAVGILVLLLVLAMIVYFLISRKKRAVLIAETSEKIDSLRNVQISKGPEDISGNPIPIMHRKETEEYGREPESYYPGAVGDSEQKTQLAEAMKEKEALKAEIEGLRIGDRVYHEYFGAGTVLDNSDVRLVQVEFGSGPLRDVRFINKSSCVAKKLMKKI